MSLRAWTSSIGPYFWDFSFSYFMFFIIADLSISPTTDPLDKANVERDYSSLVML